MYTFFVFFVCAIAQVISASNTAENNFCYLLQNVTRFVANKTLKNLLNKKSTKYILDKQTGKFSKVNCDEKQKNVLVKSHKNKIEIFQQKI